MHDFPYIICIDFAETCACEKLFRQTYKIWFSAKEFFRLFVYNKKSLFYILHKISYLYFVVVVVV